jgi:biotin transport system substrate-specific component
LTTIAPTLSSKFFPRTSYRLRDIALVIFGALFVAAMAQIRIPLPFTPVPITGQTFGVLLIAAALGSKRGSAAMALYLAAGAVGFPFFQAGTHGLSVVFGATGGYLFGFILAAYIVGLLAERGLERNIQTSILPFLVGTIVIYLCGFSWLAVLFQDIPRAFMLGVLPFIAGDVIKIVLAGLVLPLAWKSIR